MKEIIETSSAPSPIGPYAQAIRANGFIFLSGQIPLDPQTGAVVQGDIAVQTRQVMQNVSAILAAAGSGLTKIVKTTIFLIDLDDFAQLNRVYGEYLADVKPARATVQVARLPKEVRVEIEVIALA